MKYRIIAVLHSLGVLTATRQGGHAAVGQHERTAEGGGAERHADAGGAAQRRPTGQLHRHQRLHVPHG